MDAYFVGYSLGRCLLLILVFFLEIFPLNSEEKEFLIVTEEWPPYNYTENGQITGLSTEIVQTILEMIGEHYEIQILPSNRTRYVFDTRGFTILYSLFRTPEREDQYKWVGPLSDGAIYFYKRRNFPLNVNSVEDFKSAGLIACRNAGLIHDLLIQYGFENLDTSATKSIQIYQKLIHKRCDIAVSDTDLGVIYYLQKYGYATDLIERIPIKIFESDLYVAFRKDIDDSEVARWQEALDHMKETGEYGRIIQKYR